MKVLHAFLARNQLAVRGENGGNPDPDSAPDARIPEANSKDVVFSCASHSVGQEMRFGTMFKPNLLASRNLFFGE